VRRLDGLVASQQCVASDPKPQRHPGRHPEQAPPPGRLLLEQLEIGETLDQLADGDLGLEAG